MTMFSSSSTYRTIFVRAAHLPCRAATKSVTIVNRLAGMFRHVVLTQDWHPRGHFSFASTHPGKNAFDTIAASYGPQVLWPDHCVQETAGAQFHGALQIPHASLVVRKGHDRCDRFLFGVLRERPHDADRACRLSARARHPARIPGRPRVRFLRALLGRGCPARRLRGLRHRRRLPGHRHRRLGRGDARRASPRSGCRASRPPNLGS